LRGHGDVRPRAGERAGDRPADAAPAAGHQGDLAGQVHTVHGSTRGTSSTVPFRKERMAASITS
jgi:hypothetical protein